MGVTRNGVANTMENTRTPTFESIGTFEPSSSHFHDANSAKHKANVVLVLTRWLKQYVPNATRLLANFVLCPSNADADVDATPQSQWESRVSNTNATTSTNDPAGSDAKNQLHTPSNSVRLTIECAGTGIVIERGLEFQLTSTLRDITKKIYFMHGDRPWWKQRIFLGHGGPELGVHTRQLRHEGIRDQDTLVFAGPFCCCRRLVKCFGLRVLGFAFFVCFAHINMRLMTGDA